MSRGRSIGLSSLAVVGVIVARVLFRLARDRDLPAPAPEPEPAALAPMAEPPPPPVAFGLEWHVGTPPGAAIDVPVRGARDAPLRAALSEGGARIAAAAGDAVEVFERDGDGYRSIARMVVDGTVHDVGVSGDGAWVFAHVEDALLSIHEGPRGWSSAPLPSSRAPVRVRRSTRPIRVSEDGSVVAVESIVLRRRGASWASTTVEWSLGRLAVEALSRDGTRAVYCTVGGETGSLSLYDVTEVPTVIARAIGQPCGGALLEADGRIRVSQWERSDPSDPRDLGVAALTTLELEGSRLIERERVAVPSRTSGPLFGTWDHLLCGAMETATLLARGSVVHELRQPSRERAQFTASPDGSVWAAAGWDSIHVFRW